MYKFLKVCLIIFILLLGIIIGSINTVGQREYFNISKDEFENNINNNEYQNLPLIVEKDTSTKLAQKIDDKIYSTINKIFNKILGD